jgi:nucleoside-diphosphate-sugar epimerase
MHITVLAASGRTGLEIVRQALGRGHTVTAIARRPERITVDSSTNLHTVAGDITDPTGIAAVIGPDAVVLSALGTDQAGILTAGAKAVLAAGPQRVIWLGAYGTGPSATAAGDAARSLGSLLGDRLADKVEADGMVLAWGGTVFHAGLLSDDPESPSRRTVGLADAPPLDFAVKIGRATVAAAMLDEAESPRFAGAVAVPLSA